MKYTSLAARAFVILVLLLIFCGSAAGLYLIFGDMEAAQRAKLLLEASKSLLHIMTILMVGALVSGMIEWFEKNRQADRSLHDFRREFLDELQTAYQKVKKTRRALRAAGLTTKFDATILVMSIEQRDLYHKEMESLNDAQLELERLKLEIGHFPDSFAANNEIEDSLEEMEHYLRDVLTEYEKNWPTLSINPSNIPFSAFYQLVDFTGAYGGSSFRSHFSQQHDTALVKIRQELLPLKSVVKATTK